MIGLGEAAHAACVLEALAFKPGNVHRLADFDDVGLLEFLLSAAAIMPALDRARERALGATILEACRATRAVAGTNTNLGIVLLLAPLAAFDRDNLRTGLARLTLADSRDCFAAIRLAQPGGLGTASEQDVTAEPTLPLPEVMALAADRDAIARQYANGFADVFTLADEVAALTAGQGLHAAIQWVFVRQLARQPDTLIARKRGTAIAAESSSHAAAVRRGEQTWLAFDAWSRADGRGRNPGATADLMAAALFVALRDGRIPWPLTEDDRHSFRLPTGAGAWLSSSPSA